MRAVPADGVSNGDPLFFRLADTDWDNSSAREASIPLGAKAQGIQVSWARLLELQPGANLAAWAGKPAEQRKLPPDRWLAWARKEHPREQGEKTGVY
jgi:hypothetical protein